MKLTFLGTGAADWGEMHRNMPGFRRYTSTLIDGKLLIDGTAMIQDQLSFLGSVECMLYTHSHRDHFDADFQRKIQPKKAYAEKSWAADANALPLIPGVPFEEAGYTIIPLPSNHSTGRNDEQPLNYLIMTDEKKLLYATDGAWLTNRTYHAIRENAPLDAIVFDGTVGDDFPNDWRVFEHNTLTMVRDMKKALVLMGALREDGHVFVTHLARTLHADQKTLEETEWKLGSGITVCYDGMTDEI
ncbi:MAG: hypothetical protein IJC48_00330 [Clostridia bacterium]|nr:hypothetical protein [Clostridia bacterium]